MWKFYTTNKALITTKQIQLVDLKEFVIAVLDADSKIFVMHVTIRKQEKMPIYSKKQAQIGALLFDKALIEVSAEDCNYNDIFLVKNGVQLLKHTGINDYTIELEKDK